VTINDRSPRGANQRQFRRYPEPIDAGVRNGRAKGRFDPAETDAPGTDRLEVANRQRLVDSRRDVTNKRRDE